MSVPVVHAWTAAALSDAGTLVPQCSLYDMTSTHKALHR